MKNINTKIVVLLLTMALLVGGTVGGTLAWLTMKTGTITNTFTAGDIAITLTESPNLDLKMVPGKEIKKDPKVTVTAGNEACWVFIEVTRENNVDNYITYTIDSNWTQITEAPNVYYKEIASTESTASDTVIPILTNNQVFVKDNLTKTDMTTINSNSPSLGFTAYAIQKSIAGEAFAAWTQAKTLNPTS